METGKYVPVPKEDTYKLIVLAQGGDENAKGEIVRQNTGLVKKAALKFVGYGYELEDLLQLGYIGLLKAIDKFDLSYDVMFSTYAVPMIIGEIRRYMRDDGKLKMSRELKTSVRELRRAQSALAAELGHSPKISQLAEALDVTVERVAELIEADDAMNNMVSFDSFSGDGIAGGFGGRSGGRAGSGGGAGAEAFSGTVASPESRIDIIEVENLVKHLPERERKIIFLRYYHDMTQSQVALRMGISQVQVSRLEKKALGTIREKMVE